MQKKCLIAFLLLWLMNASAWAVCPATPLDCGPITAGTVTAPRINNILYAANYPTWAAAVTAATPGTMVVLPPNVTYVVNSSADRIVTTVPNVHIWAPSWTSVVQRGSGLGNRSLITVTGAGSTIEGFTVDGNSIVAGTTFEVIVGGDNSVVRRLKIINSKMDNGGMLALSGDGSRATENVLVGLALTNLHAYAIWALNHNQVFIDHNEISGSGIDAIGFNSNPDGRVSEATDNFVSNSHNYLGEQGGQIAYYDVGGSPSLGAIIARNSVIGGGPDSNGIEADQGGAMIVDNWIEGCGTFGIIVYGATNGNTNVSNNKIKNCEQGHAVPAIFIHANVPSHVQVNGNRVWFDDATSKMTYAFATGAGTLDYLEVTGNDFTAGSAGVMLDQSTQTNKVIANNLGIDNVITSVASGSTLSLPITPKARLTGTTTVTAIADTNTWNGRTVILIPDGIVSFTAGNNIFNSVTTAAGRPLTLLYNSGDSLWHIVPTGAGTATGSSVCQNGTNQVASGLFGSFSCGQGTTASGNASVAIGLTASATGAGSSARGINTTDGGAVGGDFWASGVFSLGGDAQIGRAVMRAAGTSASSVNLTTDGTGTVSGFNALNFRNFSTQGISFDCEAHQTGGASGTHGDSAYWRCHGGTCRRVLYRL